MSLRGDWVVPTFNTGVFYDKPPLMFWLMMGSFKFWAERVLRTPARGGPGDWHGLGNLSPGTAAVLGRSRFLGRIGDHLEHYFHRLGPGGNGRFGLDVRHHAGHGPVCQGGTDRRNGGSSTCQNADGLPIRPTLAFLPTSWSVYAWIGVLLGLAVLAKGPVGFLLPAASLGLFLLVMNEPCGSASRMARHELALASPYPRSC